MFWFNVPRLLAVSRLYCIRFLSVCDIVCFCHYTYHKAVLVTFHIKVPLYITAYNGNQGNIGAHHCECDARAYPLITQTLTHPACAAPKPAPCKIHYLTIREHRKVKSSYPERNNQKRFASL